MFCKLTGLAQSKVVRITPIKGVTEIIFAVNFGKNSFANTVREHKNKNLEDRAWKLSSDNIHFSFFFFFYLAKCTNGFWLPPTTVGTKTTWKVLIARPCIV